MLTMSKFCFNCGSSVDLAATFCPSCGTPQAGGQLRRPKDPAVAALFSFFIPGAGQIYVDRVGKGIAIFFAAGFLGLLAMSGGMLLGLAALGFWIWGIFDAYGSAVGMGRVSVPQQTAAISQPAMPTHQPAAARDPLSDQEWRSLKITLLVLGGIILAMLTFIFSVGRIIPGGPLDRLIN